MNALWNRTNEAYLPGRKVGASWEEGRGFLGRSYIMAIQYNGNSSQWKFIRLNFFKPKNLTLANDPMTLMRSIGSANEKIFGFQSVGLSGEIKSSGHEVL